MGRKRKEETEFIKNENGDILRTPEEMKRAFRRTLERTFYISEEENENFCEETEREVEEWVRNNENKLVRRRIIEIEDTPEITSELVKDIIKSFRKKASGPTSITRNLLLNANNNIFERYAEYLQLA